MSALSFRDFGGRLGFQRRPGFKQMFDRLAAVFFG